MTTTHTTPSDPAVPPNAALVAPAPPESVPLRNPADTWALMITTVRLAFAHDENPIDPARADTAEVFAGVWLPTPPPAHVHRGDVVVRLTPPADNDPARADLEVLVAVPGGWRTVATFAALDTRWPQHLATTVTTWMRALAGEAEQNVLRWALTLSNRSTSAELQPVTGLTDVTSVDPLTPDALTDLIDAGQVVVGDELVWNGHTATVGPHGELLHPSGPHELRISTVSALATSLATPTTVNGWHLWRRARDGQPLAQLRAELTTA